MATRYETHVPEELRLFIEQSGWTAPDSYAASPDAAPWYPPETRKLLAAHGREPAVPAVAQKRYRQPAGAQP